MQANSTSSKRNLSWKQGTLPTLSRSKPFSSVGREYACAKEL